MNGRTSISKVAISTVLMASTLGVAGSAQAATSGMLNVIDENVSWPNLDPALDPHNGTDGEFLDSIYGQLFVPKPNGGIGFDLATGYKLADGNKEALIFLRKGAEFSDGTSFDAQAVAFNVNRDMLPANACTCLSFIPALKSATVVNKYEVALHMSKPDPTIIHAMIGAAPDWPISPTAFKSEGATNFGQKPVGAGPYEVVSNVASSTIVLKPNPHYWQKGLPKLAGITFTTATSDQTAYSALQAGTAQMVIGLTTDSLIQSAKDQFRLINAKGVTATTLEMNSTAAPLNNLKAREAISYATNPAEILKVVSPGYGTVVEDSQAPGGAFYTKTVAGYHTFNPARARALVKRLGGLSIDLQYVTPGAASMLEAEALQTQLKATGIQVTLKGESFTVEEANLTGHKYDAIIGASGGIDPDVGQGGLQQRFTPQGLYGCCNDPKLTAMINRSLQLASQPARAKVFSQIYQYIAKQDYVDELFATPIPVIAAKNVGGITSAYGNVYGPVELPWANIALK